MIKSVCFLAFILQKQNKKTNPPWYWYTNLNEVSKQSNNNRVYKLTIATGREFITLKYLVINIILFP